MDKSISTKKEDLRTLAEGSSPLKILQILTNLFPGKVVFSSSFGLEDQVLTDMIFTNNVDISVFTIDTGRLFKETYSVWSKSLSKYQKEISVFYPDHEALESFVSENGPNSFYSSTENRKRCCLIRKVEPLCRALRDMDVWVTGIRSEQSANRSEMDWIEWDDIHQVIKIHPLFDWSLSEVKAYIRENNVPYNVLHDRGFPSIGCAPCTRAIKPGEDARAGRWWWEDQSKKECGLHITNSGVGA